MAGLDGASGSFGWSDVRIATAVALVALLVGLLFWEPVAPGVWHDDGAYLLLGKSIADGEGLRYSGVSQSPPGAKFPPAYPLLLSVSWKVWPDATGVGPAASLLNMLLLAIAAGLTWHFVRRFTDLPILWAGVGLVPWLSPDLWRLGMIALSEPLFMVALALGLMAAFRVERSSDTRWLLLGSFPLAGIMYVRSVGVAAVGALVLALTIRLRLRDAAILLGTTVVLVLPWVLWSNAAARTMPEPLLDVMGPYGPWILGQALADPLQSLSQALAGTEVRAIALFSALLPGLPRPALWVLGPVVLGVAIAGLLRRDAAGERSWTLPAFVGAYLLILWLWPHQERRLVVPLLPWLAIGAALAAHRIPAGRLARGVRWGVLGWAGLFAIGGLTGLVRGRHLESYRLREVMLARAMSAVEERVPLDGVVGAPELWGALHLQTGRTVAPSARFLPLGGGESWGTPSEQFELWEAVGIEYVVLELAGTVHKAAMDELDLRCPGAVQLLASWGGGLLVRLDWDEACRAELGL
jgi:hypothetical protein